MLLQETEPGADRLRVPVLNLDQPAQGDAPEVLLRLLEDEDVTRDGPALGHAWEWDGALGWQGEVVCRAEGEVGEELEVADAVGADLQVADGHAVGWCAAERAQVCCLDVAGKTGGLEDLLGFVGKGSTGGQRCI